MRAPLRSAALTLLAALSVSPAGAQQPHAREQTADQQVLHALNRLAFGPRPGDAARVRTMGVDRWIEQQLAPSTIADPGMTSLLAGYPGVAIEPAEMTRLYREQVAERRALGRRAGVDGDSTMQPMDSERPARARAPSDADRQLAGALNDVASARLARAVTSERQLEEMMADFWANHFSVARSKGLTRLYIGHYDRDVIRPHAMGRFRDLLGAVARSPAMLFYLDNARSVADQSQQPARRGAPQSQPNRPRGLNENYARELLELHTLGVDGGYTQHDVTEVARALTGWSIDPQRGEFTFRRVAHDRGAKQVLGTSLPAGRGIVDGEEVLDLVARHPATARHIARKLVVRFVSDSPPPALVERGAATFARTDGDITETLRTIVTSDEFFSQQAWRAKVKTPFELVASTYRALGQQPDTSPRAAQLVARLGQPIYGRQTPDGWPDTAAEWMNAGAILNRINFGLLVAGGRVPGIRLQEWPVLTQLRAASCAADQRPANLQPANERSANERSADPRPANQRPTSGREKACEQAVDILAAELLGGAMSVETREILMSGANPLLAAAPTMNEGAVTARGINLAPLQQLVGLALGSPEFQRR